MQVVILLAWCILPTSCIKPVDLIKLSVNIRLAATWYLRTYIQPACSSQLAASLLTTCNKLVIIKPEQAMRTHPDIGFVIADLLQLARFWLCSESYSIYFIVVLTNSLLTVLNSGILCHSESLLHVVRHTLWNKFQLIMWNIQSHKVNKIALKQRNKISHVFGNKISVDPVRKNF